MPLAWNHTSPLHCGHGQGYKAKKSNQGLRLDFKGCTQRFVSLLCAWSQSAPCVISPGSASLTPREELPGALLLITDNRREGLSIEVATLGRSPLCVSC